MTAYNIDGNNNDNNNNNNNNNNNGTFSCTGTCIRHNVNVMKNPLECKNQQPQSTCSGWSSAGVRYKIQATMVEGQCTNLAPIHNIFIPLKGGMAVQCYRITINKTTPDNQFTEGSRK